MLDYEPYKLRITGASLIRIETKMDMKRKNVMKSFDWLLMRKSLYEVITLEYVYRNK